MKKEEKTRRSYEKILSAAVAEFGTKSYDSASLTTICKENQIPKGLLYHNFKNKDDLYLRCVEVCFHEMTAYLREREPTDETEQGYLQTILRCRQRFFQENPQYGTIFFHAVLQPPPHLRQEIRKIRREFDAFSVGCYQKFLEKLPLRDGITMDTALEYFIIFQEMFNGYFQNRMDASDDFHALVLDHEVNLSKILDIMLYGILKKETAGTAADNDIH